jgi:hypothetical protein
MLTAHWALVSGQVHWKQLPEKGLKLPVSFIFSVDGVVT